MSIQDVISDVGFLTAIMGHVLLLFGMSDDPITGIEVARVVHDGEV